MYCSFLIFGGRFCTASQPPGAKHALVAARLLKILLEEGEGESKQIYTTWRIIPVSKWLVTPIYKPFRPFGRGITPVMGAY